LELSVRVQKVSISLCVRPARGGITVNKGPRGRNTSKEEVAEEKKKDGRKRKEQTIKVTHKVIREGNKTQKVVQQKKPKKNMREGP